MIASDASAPFHGFPATLTGLRPFASPAGIVLFGGLATAGALPGPVQRATADVTAHVGIHLPGRTEARPEAGFVSQALAEDSIVVAASARHPVFKGTPRMRDLVAYRWVLQPPGAPTRDWIDHAFDSKHLPRPEVQIESSMLVMLPPLIAETGLLSFISRHHVGERHSGAVLKEVALKETTMRRRLTVTWRENSYLPPAARRVVELLALTARA